MPWKDYPTDVRQFSGLVRDAAMQRFGSAAAVELVADAAKAADIKLSFQSYSSIAKLYGEFVGVRTTRETLTATGETIARTGIDQAITADVIARPPWAPDVRVTATNPFMLVTGRYTMDSPEGPITGYFSHRYSAAEVHTYNQVLTDMQLQMELGAGGTDLSGATLETITGIEWSTA